MKALLILILGASLFYTPFTYSAGLPSSSAPRDSKRSGAGTKKYRFYAGAGYSLQTKASYPSTNDSALATSYLTEVNYSDNLNFEAGMVYLPNYAFGFSAGINYELDKKVTGAKQNGTTLTGSDSSLQVTNILLGTSFRFDSVYVPVSLIYSLVSMKDRSGGTNSTFEGKGGVGGQAGLGILLSENFAIEWVYRYNAISLNTRSTTGQTIDYGSGNLTSFDILFKYYF